MKERGSKVSLCFFLELGGCEPRAQQLVTCDAAHGGIVLRNCLAKVGKESEHSSRTAFQRIMKISDNHEKWQYRGETRRILQEGPIEYNPICTTPIGPNSKV